MLRKLSVVALSCQKIFYNLGMPRRFRKIRKQRKPVEAGSGRFWAAFSDAYTFGATLLVSMGIFGVAATTWISGWAHYPHLQWHCC